MSMIGNSCPCCGSPLLRHVRQSEIYWFCKSCWQEVPVLTVNRVQGVEAARSTGIRAESNINS
ncbi:MAG: hypothetical protein KME64_11015 [Scytonematopsis contorta HA4267-MV1]|jgi:uncharacterized Zn finger protein (UPF0148 family)|nr:hypothetical protein [Scytonematopsis contorta HA4267-MV1]